MKIFEIILISIITSIFIISIIILIKNEVTFNHLTRISDAIYKYNICEIEDAYRNDRHSNLIPYNCCRAYEDILFDIFDWGDKHIIPSEYYERIKPYMQED